MRISDFGGEQSLIKLIAEKFGAVSGGRLLKPIGDDTAVISIGQKALLLTCDMLIENTHFRRDIIDAYSLGWKSVAVNLSDIAAMGGIPEYTLISLGISDAEVSWVDECYKGIAECCKAYGSSLIGGDTCVSEIGEVWSVFQTGQVDREKVLYRNGARPGDLVMVTGSLGSSRAGLEMLLKYGLDESIRVNQSAVFCHLKPKPRILEGQLLSKIGATACMDVSDGLASDLPKMCEASGTGAEIETEKIPYGQDVELAAEKLGISAERLAIEGGEDYELLFTINPDDEDIVYRSFTKNQLVQVTQIGIITDEKSVLLKNKDGSKTPLAGGWQHFPKG